MFELAVTDQPAMLLAHAGVALAIGVVVGSERERSNPDPCAPGVRTFALLAVAGAVAMIVDPVAVAAIIVAGAAVALSPLLRPRRKSDPPGFGATTIAAAVLMPVLGAVAMVAPGVAAAVAVAVAVVLVSKERVHGFVRDTVTETELGDALKFFVVALIVLPLLPTEPLDPWGVVVPQRIGVLVTALTGIGWLGYIAVRAFGARRGLPLAGLAGGFVSSTATTATMARRARDDSNLVRPAVAAAVLSKVPSLAVLTALVFAIDPSVGVLLLAPVIVMVAVLSVTAGLLLWSRRSRPTRNAAEDSTGAAPDGLPAPDDASAGLGIGRPFALKPALILAAVITGVLLASKVAADWLGAGAAVVVAALSGVADTQAAAVASADLASTGALTGVVAMFAVVATLVTNTLMKVILGFGAGGRRVGMLLAAALIPALLAAVAAAAVVASVTT